MKRNETKTIKIPLGIEDLQGRISVLNNVFKQYAIKQMVLKREILFSFFLA